MYICKALNPGIDFTPTIQNNSDRIAELDGKWKNIKLLEDLEVMQSIIKMQALWLESNSTFYICSNI